MDYNKPMLLLLIEDDVAECIKFKDCATTRDDIKFVGMTCSSFEGLNLVKNHMPEGVILDLELHKGKGSGLEFLSTLNGTKLNFRPLIVVVTNSASNIVYNHVHKNGADLVFYKQQSDYSADMVINSLLALRKSLHTVKNDDLSDDLQSVETPEERRIRITERINAELDLIGINARFKGRNYLFEAVFLLLHANEDSSDSVINQVCMNHKLAYSSVTRAMQTAINNAWSISSIDDLQVHYTARINYKTGVPTPTEFIYYYADKIKKFL